MAEAYMQVVWTDAGGNTQLHTLHTNTGASGILGQLASLAAAVPTLSWEGTPVRSTASPTTVDYALLTQVAWLRFSDAAGYQAQIALVSPPTTIFKADGVTVDPSTITSLISACIGTLLTAAGNPVTTFVGGLLQPTGG